MIDYGMGNVGSIKNMLSKIGAESTITSHREVIGAAPKIILPGIGAFDNAMRRLSELDLISVLNRRVLDDGAPFLGVCLGMQLITKTSEEGRLPGLGWIDAHTRRFRFTESEGLAVPHMGWNRVNDEGRSSLLSGLPKDARFYFVHSYYVDCHIEENVLGTTEYGFRFASVIGRDNIIGAQFHPEKSHRYGMILLKAFAEA